MVAPRWSAGNTPPGTATGLYLHVPPTVLGLLGPWLYHPTGGIVTRQSAGRDIRGQAAGAAWPLTL
jgi:hypothetical protein